MTDDLLEKYRDSLATIHMDTPTGDILARGDRLRSRRRRRRAAVGGSCLAVVAVALTLVVTGTSGGQNGAELAAFTLTSAPGGASTLTLHKNASTRLDPDALRQALAERGVTAKVTVGAWCDTATEPAGIRDAVTVGHDSTGTPNLTIHPSAIPAGAELSIGYFPTRSVLALIQANSPLTCATDPKQAAQRPSQGSGAHLAIVLTNA
jgi:hypothetical protein